jgi:DNA-binding LytR/AlgR family response regulator
VEVNLFLKHKYFKGILYEVYISSLRFITIDDDVMVKLLVSKLCSRFSKIILTTSGENFAFKYSNVLDYFVKPLYCERIKKAIHKLVKIKDSKIQKKKI